MYGLRPGYRRGQRDTKRPRDPVKGYGTKKGARRPADKSSNARTAEIKSRRSANPNVKPGNVTARTQGTQMSQQLIKKSGGGSNPYKMTSEVARNIRAYLDPFSSKEGARLPDGAVTHSLGVHHRNVFEMETGFANTLDNLQNVIEMILYPGLNGGLVYRTRSTINSEKSQVKNILFEDADFKMNAKMEYDWVAGQEEGKEVDVCQTGALLETNNSLSKWRVVSQGVRFTSTNSDENNDGWFEACRFAYTPDMSNWTLQEFGDANAPIGATVPGTYELKDMKYVPNSTIFSRFENEDGSVSTNIAEQKSYCTGALRHLHNTQFMLGHFGQNNDLRQIQSRYKLPEDDIAKAKIAETENDPDAEPPIYTKVIDSMVPTNRWKYAVGDKGSADAKKIFDSLIDTDMDCIYIRVYGRAREPFSIPSKLLTELATHHEIVYENDTTLAKYMRPAMKNIINLTRAQKMKSQRDAYSPASGVATFN